MRMPRARFTVGRMMVAVAIAALVMSIFELPADRPGFGFGLIAVSTVGIALVLASRRLRRDRAEAEPVRPSGSIREGVYAVALAVAIVLASVGEFYLWATYL